MRYSPIPGRFPDPAGKVGRMGAIAPLAAQAVPDTPALNEALEEAEEALADLQALDGVPGFDADLCHLEALASVRLARVNLPEWRLREAMFGDGKPTWVVAAFLGARQATETAMALGHGGVALDAAAISTLHAPLLSKTEPGDPAEDADALMADLSAFLARRDVPPLVQSAIAHAQLARIHPFEAGNGPTCRALGLAVLARRGLLPTHALPLSAALRRSPTEYARALALYADGRIDVWCEFVANRATEAATQAVSLHREVADLSFAWRARLGPRRAHAAAAKLLTVLPRHPVLNVGLAAALMGTSEEGARRALNDTTSAGITSLLVQGKRHTRVWEVRALTDRFDAFDGSLAATARPTQEELRAARL